MKTLFTLLAVLTLAGCGRAAEPAPLAQENPTNVMDAGIDYSAAVIGSVVVCNTITIGPVSISCTNGAVTIAEGVTMDAASREFWRALQDAFPACFPQQTTRKEAP